MYNRFLLRILQPPENSKRRGHDNQPQKRHSGLLFHLYLQSARQNYEFGKHSYKSRKKHRHGIHKRKSSMDVEFTFKLNHKIWGHGAYKSPTGSSVLPRRSAPFQKGKPFWNAFGGTPPPCPSVLTDSQIKNYHKSSASKEVPLSVFPTRIIFFASLSIFPKTCTFCPSIASLAKFILTSLNSIP